MSSVPPYLREKALQDDSVPVFAQKAEETGRQIVDETWKRDWITDITQRVDDKQNLMWEKQSAKDRKAGIPATPILNFPAGGYFQYSSDTGYGGGASVVYQVPERFTDHITGKDYTGSRATKTSVPAIEKRVKFAREYLEIIKQGERENLFVKYMADTGLDQEVGIDWDRKSRFEGDSGFAEPTEGVAPASFAAYQPQGFEYRRDEDGNEIWKDGRRVKATLAEGRGITRPGKVAANLRPFGRGGMYGGADQINERLANTNMTNIERIQEIAEFASPARLLGAGQIPGQTPLDANNQPGEDLVRASDNTKLTRDWTEHNIRSINPEDMWIDNPYSLFMASSEGMAIKLKRYEGFQEWADEDYEHAKKQLANGPFKGKELHWIRDLGVPYGATDHDWAVAKAKKEALWKKWAAEVALGKNPGLDTPGSKVQDGKAIQANGVVMDGRGRPTGEVIAVQEEEEEEDPLEEAMASMALQDDSDSESGIDSDDMEDYQKYFGEGNEVVVSDEDEDEDDFVAGGEGAYGNKITSGTGRQLQWGQ
tara:strand:+ start:11236 stop:12849 length:1614 start_codon:yes stop_codon:yes gene_type:complete